MSLEDLMSVEVTTVSKRSESVFNAPAAVYAVTAEEIRRSGARTLPEVLRMVPGVEVAQLDANKWAVTVRGFSGRLANKLLVMIDGRSVYTPLFSGVYWELEHLLLEDIERIEVVRGPGGTLWGANAVNGVINVITKPAADTQGGYAEAGVGTEEHGFGAFRYGFSRGNVDARVFGMGFARDGYLLESGASAGDDWRGGQGGFRVDWHRSPRDEVTVQGDMFVGSAGVIEVDSQKGGTATDETDLGAGNLLARWSRVLQNDSTATLQLYYDRVNRQNNVPAEVRNTFDVDFQLQTPQMGRQQLVAGAEYRVTGDERSGNAFAEGGRTLQLWSAFAQDQITLVPDLAFLTLGSKFEHNDFTGFEVQPSVRLLWTPDERFSAWAAVSRAVRTPSRGESDASIALQPFEDPQTGLPGYVLFTGNPDLSAEVLLAYEAGFRAQSSERVFFDFAAFLQDYDDIAGLEVGMPFVEVRDGPRLVVPVRSKNLQTGRSAGFEAFARVQVSQPWQAAVGYSFLDLVVEPEGLPQFPSIRGVSPRHQVQLRSYLDLPRNLELDAAAYFNDTLPGYPIDHYWRFDLRLGWQPFEGVALSVAMFNLADASHEEFGFSYFELPTLVQRSAYGMLRWNF